MFNLYFNKAVKSWSSMINVMNYQRNTKRSCLLLIYSKKIHFSYVLINTDIFEDLISSNLLLKIVKHILTFKRGATVPFAPLLDPLLMIYSMHAYILSCTHEI